MASTNMKLDVEKIDPHKCPRCGGANTEFLGNDGLPTSTYLCVDCEKGEGQEATYEVVRGNRIESVVWDEDNETHEIYDERYMLERHAPDLLAAARAVIANWKRGDLAGAVRRLAEVAAKIDRIEGVTYPKPPFSRTRLPEVKP